MKVYFPKEFFQKLHFAIEYFPNLTDVTLVSEDTDDPDDHDDSDDSDDPGDHNDPDDPVDPMTMNSTMTGMEMVKVIEL